MSLSESRKGKTIGQRAGVRRSTGEVRHIAGGCRSITVRHSLRLHTILRQPYSRESQRQDERQDGNEAKSQHLRSCRLWLWLGIGQSYRLLSFAIKTREESWRKATQDRRGGLEGQAESVTHDVQSEACLDKEGNSFLSSTYNIVFRISFQSRSRTDRYRQLGTRAKQSKGQDEDRHQSHLCRTYPLAPTPPPLSGFWVYSKLTFLFFQITQRVSQMRGAVITAARPLVQAHSGLGSANDSGSRASVKDRASMLRERGRFLYQVRCSSAVNVNLTSSRRILRRRSLFSRIRSFNKSSRARSLTIRTVSALNLTHSLTLLLSKLWCLSSLQCVLQPQSSVSALTQDIVVPG